MSLTRKRFQLIFSLALLAGYGWLALVGRMRPEEAGTRYDVCLIHHFAHIPCPSCGSTRSVLSLLHGDMAGAIYWNPLGLIIFAVLLVAPFWMAYDLLLKKESFYRFYLRSEETLRRKWVAIAATVLLLANWAWNIWKG